MVVRVGEQEKSSKSLGHKEVRGADRGEMHPIEEGATLAIGKEGSSRVPQDGRSVRRGNGAQGERKMLSRRGAGARQ